MAALAGFASLAAADPEDSDPDLAKRDQDYAAGKKAAERKDWAEAVKLYQRAEKRHPDQADLQNSLGYAYRNLKQFDLAFKHYKRAIEIDQTLIHQLQHQVGEDRFAERGVLEHRARVHRRARERVGHAERTAPYNFALFDHGNADARYSERFHDPR